MGSLHEFDYFTSDPDAKVLLAIPLRYGMLLTLCSLKFGSFRSIAIPFWKGKEATVNILVLLSLKAQPLEFSHSIETYPLEM